jgi:MFS family permease
MTPGGDPHAPPTGESAFAPLRHRAFLVLWVATVVGNVGGWVRDTGSAWLMTELAPSPLMVAAVQAAATLPIFLFSLPAGALADIVDRRRLMIAVQVGLACVSLALGLLTAAGLMDPLLLIVLTLAAGTGAALAGPAWQSVVPELVPRADLKPAVALNSLGINVSRAIGPALAGVLIAYAGTASAYFLDVASYLVTIAALAWWRPSKERPAAPEHLGGAMRAGLRYATASAPLRRVLLRAVIFFLPASCYWALLPLVSRGEIGAGAGGYGLLLGAVGVGAIGGALLLPRIRRALSVEALALGATLLMGLATLGLSFAATLPIGMALSVVAGAAWLTMLTTLNGTAQAVLPNWVRGRGLAIYLTAFFGSMTIGSLAWGQIAAWTSLDAALVAAGVLGTVAAFGARLLLLPPTDDADLSPSSHWPAPSIADGVEPAGGPIMVTITYDIELSDQAAFAEAARHLGAIVAGMGRTTGA